MNNHRRHAGKREKYAEKKVLSKMRGSKAASQQVETKTDLSRIVIVAGALLLAWALVWMLPSYLRQLRHTAKLAATSATETAP